MVPDSFYTPDWQVHPRVHALMTTRSGGSSKAPFESFNLGAYVGDPAAEANRKQLIRDAALPSTPRWLHQVHGTDCVPAGSAQAESEADASWTSDTGVVLAALAADCLPVLFAARDGSCVGAAHAGWRGLAAGVLENTVRKLPAPPGQLDAWLGPAIGPTAFEVGGEVREAFADGNAIDSDCFAPSAEAGKWMADIFSLARRRLQRLGLQYVSGGGICTVQHRETFFSHRRDRGASGRMAALIWLTCGS